MLGPRNKVNWKWSNRGWQEWTRHFRNQWTKMDWNEFSSVQSLSRVWLFVILWTAAHQAFLCFTVSLSFLRLMSIESVMPTNHHIPCHPLLFHWVSDAIQPSHPLSPSSPPAFNLSLHQGLLQWVSSLHQVARVLELQLWTGMGKFNSHDHYIYYCVQESLRRNGVALIVNKESEMQYLGTISKMREWLCSFPMIFKTFNITVIQVYAPASNAKQVEVKRFYDDLQDLIELTTKKDVLFI